MAKGVAGVRNGMSGHFGFDKWCLKSLDDFRDKFMKSVEAMRGEFEESVWALMGEGIRLAAKEYKCYARLPAAWDFDPTPCDGDGEAPPSDPTTIYVQLPVGEWVDSGPTWSFTLSEIVDDLIEGGVSNDGKLGVDHVRSAIAVRDSLRALANRIDASLPDGNL